MTNHTLYAPFDAQPVGRVPPVLEHRCDALGLRCHALPPGPVEVYYKLENYIFDINMPVLKQEMALNSDRLKMVEVPSESVGIAPPETELKLRTHNVHWGALVEIDPDRASAVFLEATDGSPITHRFHDHVFAPEIAQIGRRLIAHLRRPSIDRLYVESLGLAVIGLSLARFRDGVLAPTDGQDTRIARAIDYAEAHLGEALTVADLAAAAYLSPSHFSRTFKAAVGEPVWSYVQRRRVERAKELLLSTSHSIVQVAHDCGFANQAHLTTCFKRQFGVTPGAFRQN